MWHEGTLAFDHNVMAVARLLVYHMRDRSLFIGGRGTG